MDSNIGHNFSLKLYYFTHYSIFLCLVTHVTSTSFFYPIYYLIIFLFIARRISLLQIVMILLFFVVLENIKCIKVSLKKSSYYRVLDSTLVQYLFSCTLRFIYVVRRGQIKKIIARFVKRVLVMSLNLLKERNIYIHVST